MLFARILILAAIVFFGYRYVKKLVHSVFREPLQHGHDDGGPEQAVFKGEMVRDPVCNAYLARDRALTAKKEGDTFHFCSESCREKFIEAGAPVEENREGSH